MRSSARRAGMVVVSHEASLTGAPRVAVEIVRALERGGHRVACILRAGGALQPVFEDAATHVRREPLARLRALMRRVPQLRGLVNRLDEAVALAMLRRTRPAFVYLNSVKSACYARPALRLHLPVVLHSHELGILASSTLRRFPLGPRWRDVRLVACSASARETLAELVGVPPAQVGVLTSPVDTAAVVAAGAPVAGAPAAGASLAGAPVAASGAGSPLARPDGADGPGAPLPSVVAACGTVNERKGTDLWLQMARFVRDKRPDLHVRYLWIGERPGSWPGELVHELALDDVVELAGPLADPYPTLAAVDVFTLPSREDAFPLVVLEAMALARPVVAFDVGSVRDQLGDAGVLVPAGQPEALADGVIRLLDDRRAAGELGHAAAERVHALHDVAPFHAAVRRLVDDVAGASLAPDRVAVP